jgi:hypothetical protein
MACYPVTRGEISRGALLSSRRAYRICRSGRRRARTLAANTDSPLWRGRHSHSCATAL